MPEPAGQPVLTGIRGGHEIDLDRLRAWLAGVLPGLDGSVRVRQFEVGQSNPTYLIECGPKRYVLRKQPPGTLLPSAHRVDREYRVQQALKGTGVPVPEMIALCQDKSVLGADFYLMQHLEGRVYDDPRLPTLPHDQVRQIYEDFARVLACLHGLNPGDIGLERYGRPTGYYARQITLWTGQYKSSETGHVADMDRLIDWLPGHIPADNEAAIVHGDFRIGNCIIHPSEPRIIALLDWELSTIGHPLADLAYACMGYHGAISTPDFLDVDFEATGLPREEKLLADYCRFAGRSGIDNWTFHLAFSAFRSAGILQGVYKRSLMGNAASQDAARFRDSARQVSGWAMRMIESEAKNG